MKEIKNKLRKEMKAKLKCYTEQEHTNMSTYIQKHLFETKQWQDAKTIGITVSRFPEVRTDEIIEKAWNEGKKIAVPKCNPTSSTMDFYEIVSFHELEVVYFGLREPIVSKTKYVPPSEIDLIIVPGLIFDKEGYRIGFGGGYFDRYLQKFHGRKISLAFYTQVNEEVPRESFDIPVEAIITNEGVLTC
ncbi:MULTISPECIES: 5-formyltetrahydrofolate cyclo-ligase [Bacillus]|uniref:5-formyltetrahydrofolate cyclo-ligase n=1 Tax=Bacillus TaxID=1386 RepID=UPI00159655EC|nr:MULTISPECIES: 5-formyltetrahydrofolate cyclo-ligase [Bacillus]